jgi:hypothetical protein
MTPVVHFWLPFAPHSRRELSRRSVMSRLPKDALPSGFAGVWKPALSTVKRKALATVAMLAGGQCFLPPQRSSAAGLRLQFPLRHERVIPVCDRRTCCASLLLPAEI